MTKGRVAQKTIDKVIGSEDSYHITPRHQRFVDEYLIDLNSSRAYKAVYNCSDRTASSQGWQFLRKPAIRKAIQRAMKERQQRCHVDQDRVIKELAKIAFANIRDVMSWNQHGITLKDSDQLQEPDAAAIAEVSVVFNEHGANVKVKMYDKRAALVDLGNHLGIFERKTEIKDPVQEAQKICKIVQEMISTTVATDEEKSDASKDN